MLLLLDSGSSHSFFSAAFVKRLQLPTIPIPSVPVKMANGKFILCEAMVPHLTWISQGHTLATDLQVLQLDAYDAVLGMDWLDAHSPMNCRRKEKAISFDHDGEWITFQGLTTQPTASPEQMDFHALQQLDDHNEIWALAVVEYLSDTITKPAASPEVPVLLDNFVDVFAEPEDLPPERQYDHTITLEPGTRPPNLKPYRYSLLQKDEME
jgi:hypothetical protein